MPKVEQLSPASLKKYSELVGGRKLRDFEYFHRKNYATTGHTSLEFFRTDGLINDFSGASTVECSNIVQSGKFDEPFLITGISVAFMPLDTTYPNKIADTLNVLQSGRIELWVNNVPVFERAPLARVGSPIHFTGFNAIPDNGTAMGWVSSGIAPHKLDPYQFCEEGITFKVVCTWSTAQTVNTASTLSVFLHGGKYFKN